MELLQLRYFCDAAQTENFSHTAAKYLVPTSGISQAVKRLEGELGCELFEHRGNRIHLNDSGRRFLAYASEALSLLDRGREELSDTDTPVGELRILCLSNRSALTRVVEIYTRRYPQVSLVLHHGPLAQEDYDLLIADACPVPYDHRQLFVEEEICLALPESHPLASVPSLSLSALRGERFITMTDGGSLHAITVKACEDAGFTPKIAIRTDDPYYIRKYVELGLGIALVPVRSWAGFLGAPLCLRSVGGIRRSTYAYLPKGKHPRAAIRCFLALMAEEKDKDGT